MRGVYSVIDQLSRTHLSTLERLIFHLVRYAGPGQLQARAGWSGILPTATAEAFGSAGSPRRWPQSCFSKGCCVDEGPLLCSGHLWFLQLCGASHHCRDVFLGAKGWLLPWECVRGLEVCLSPSKQDCTVEISSPLFIHDHVREVQWRCLHLWLLS